MATNFEHKHHEVIKTTLMEAALRNTDERGFATTKGLWEAVLDTFFTGSFHDTLPSEWRLETIPYRQLMWQYQIKKTADIQFLESYQRHLEIELSAADIAHKDSPIWLKIAAGLIRLRDHLTHANQAQQNSERLQLAKLYLENQPGKAIEHLAQVLLDSLPWHLQGEFTTSLFGADKIIDLLLTAHEKTDETKRGRNALNNGIGAMTVLLERDFQQFQSSLSRTLIYKREAFYTTYYLSRLYCLKGEPNKAIECLSLVCGNVSFLDWAVKPCGFNADYVYMPCMLWHRLASLQHQQKDLTGAKENAIKARALITQYLEAMRSQFAEYKQLDILQRYLAEGGELKETQWDERFSNYSQLLQLQTSLCELEASCTI